VVGGSNAQNEQERTTIRSVELSGNSSGLKDNECGQMGVKQIAGTSG